MCNKHVGGGCVEPRNTMNLMGNMTGMEAGRGVNLDTINANHNLGPWMHAPRRGRRGTNKESLLKSKFKLRNLGKGWVSLGTRFWQI